MDVFVSWSGGKDCYLALYWAKRLGINVKSWGVYKER